MYNCEGLQKRDENDLHTVTNPYQSITQMQLREAPLSV
jgi:hypothetical protein